MFLSINTADCLAAAVKPSHWAAQIMWIFLAQREADMNFKPISLLSKKVSPSARGRALAAAQPQPSRGRDALADVTKNLLKHIPGEASGFYLLAADSLDNPTLGNLGVIFTCAFVLLVLVRWLAKASWGVMVTTILAFVIWMLIFDKGFLHFMWPDLLPAPMGLIVAMFYSTAVTILASAGKIK
jgi:hypothetical protein